MRRAEIKKKFDEIVAFAEVEKFLDTPVKRYSSGMYVRLAFAVAAHLEPEILIVDEVLAVGDAEFQKKCLGKMQEVSKGGRTVLFVSHNLAAVLNLCTKGILLQDGRVVKSAAVREVCETYTRTSQSSRQNEKATGIFRSLILVDNAGNALNNVTEGEPIRFRCALRPPAHRCLLSLVIQDKNNNPLCELFEKSFSVLHKNGADTVLSVQIDSLPLRPGQYSVDCWCGDPFSNTLERFTAALEFEVVASKTSDRGAILLGQFWFPSVWREHSDEICSDD
jgi:lipopolysaccharide transport system ATP-binding protein